MRKTMIRGIVAPVLFALLVLASPRLAVAQCDTTPPNLTAFNFTPTSINTTSAAQNVTCNMTLNDSPAGVASASCTFRYIDSGTGAFQSHGCSTTTGSAGVYSCVVSMPRYSAAGVWKAQVTAVDNVGNTKNLTDIDLLIAGFPTDLTVTSDTDIVAPNITALSFTPNAVTVSTGAKTVTCTMTLTDAKSGVDTASCFFSAPTASSQQAQGCTSNTLKSGTRQNGVFECVLTIPQYADAGTWTANVIANDAVGNSAVFDPAALQAKGLPTNLTVTSSPEDITGPNQTSFTFSPTTANAGAGPTTITCTFGFTDSPAGVSTSSCDFDFNDFTVFPPVSQSQGCTATALASGTRQSGTMSCTFVIPRYSAPGNWFATTNYTDAVGNSSTFNPATPLSVTCGGGGDPECTLTWSNKTTLTWNAIAGATRYNVYRGDPATLPNYGTCQNSRDPNLTDTQFVETQNPSPAGKGFTFLVSYLSGGVEKGLGKRSNGTARTVSPPCP
ncbi:MAG: hypothetical protein U0V87_13260 [Acidobacteriota bacterium]